MVSKKEVQLNYIYPNLIMYTRSEIIAKANNWLNQQPFKFEMTVLEDSIQDHQSCYSFAWCKKSEKHLNWKDRSVWVGSGRLLASKKGELFDFEGSAPGIDWIHQFELRVNGLEDYWYLEIPFHKKDISKIKTAIQCSNTELLQLLTEHQTIIYTEPKAWNDWSPSFQKIADDLNTFGVPCQVEIKTRKKNQSESR